MLSSISSGGLNVETEAEEATRFQNALLELKGLRSQLHQAADYCETTFLKTKEKNEAVENTKEYVCRAMVTVVDHLGNVTSNLESCISQTNAFNEVELRLNCLNQRLLSCKQYAQKLELSRLRWSEILPRYHPRYVSPVSKNAEQLTRSSSINQCRDLEDLPFAKTVGNCKPDIFTEKPMPVLLYKFYTYNLSPSKSLSHGFSSKKDDKEKTLGTLQKAILPAGDHGFSVRSKGPNSTFYFQVSNQKRGRHRKSKLGSDIFSLLKQTKQMQQTTLSPHLSFTSKHSSIPFVVTHRLASSTIGRLIVGCRSSVTDRPFFLSLSLSFFSPNISLSPTIATPHYLSWATGLPPMLTFVD